MCMYSVYTLNRVCQFVRSSKRRIFTNTVKGSETEQDYASKHSAKLHTTLCQLETRKL